MKAMMPNEMSGPERLVDGDTGDPHAGAGEVLVHALALVSGPGGVPRATAVP